MSTSPDDLQFERAVPVSGESQGIACAGCTSPITDSYYLANGSSFCPTCVEQAKAAIPQEPGPSLVLRAALYGFGAALLGTLLYYAILAISGYEIGWIALIVGWLVGKAVQRGGDFRGGWKLQTIAVAFTYLSIVGSYVPIIVKSAIEQAEKKQAKENPPAPQAQPPQNLTFGQAITQLGFAVVILLALALVIPFLQGFSSILGLFIIGIGLFEAWKLNRRPALNISGPHSLTKTGAATA